MYNVIMWRLWCETGGTHPQVEKNATDTSTKRAADTDEGAVSLNATEVLILNTRLTMIQERAVEANKVALEEEKTRDETKSVHHHHLLSFLHARTSCHAILLFFLVYRGTLSGGRSVVGVRHDHVCEVKDPDATPVIQISWFTVVRVPSRPFGQKTSLFSQYQQGFGIATRGLPRL
jgi:hypothetical protein